MKNLKKMKIKNKIIIMILKMIIKCFNYKLQLFIQQEKNLYMN